MHFLHCGYLSVVRVLPPADVVHDPFTESPVRTVDEDIERRIRVDDERHFNRAESGEVAGVIERRPRKVSWWAGFHRYVSFCRAARERT